MLFGSWGVLSIWRVSSNVVSLKSDCFTILWNLPPLWWLLTGKRKGGLVTANHTYIWTVGWFRRWQLVRLISIQELQLGSGRLHLMYVPSWNLGYGSWQGTHCGHNSGCLSWECTWFTACIISWCLILWPGILRLGSIG